MVEDVVEVVVVAVVYCVCDLDMVFVAVEAVKMAEEVEVAFHNLVLVFGLDVANNDALVGMDADNEKNHPFLVRSVDLEVCIGNLVDNLVRMNNHLVENNCNRAFCKVVAEVEVVEAAAVFDIVDEDEKMLMEEIEMNEMEVADNLVLLEFDFVVKEEEVAVVVVWIVEK